MRFIRIASVAPLVALLMLGCVTTPSGEGYVGRYIKEGNPSEYTELRADDTFVIEERGATLAGDYEVNGETLTIFVGSASATGTIKDNKIIDDEGQAWIKQ